LLPLLPLFPRGRAVRRSGVVFHHHVLKEARLKRQGRNLSQRAVLFARALIFARAGLAVGRISLFMALLSPRADNYRLKASNAGPPLSTMTATLRCLKMKHSSLSTSATNCCNLFVVETRLFGFKACDVSVCALSTSVPVAFAKQRGGRDRQSGQNGRSKRKDAWKCAGAADRKRPCHGGLAIGFRRSFPNWVRDRLARRRVRASVCWRRLSDSHRH
jgi:hypothetical protein